MRPSGENFSSCFQFLNDIRRTRYIYVCLCAYTHTITIFPDLNSPRIQIEWYKFESKRGEIIKRLL